MHLIYDALTVLIGTSSITLTRAKHFSKPKFNPQGTHQ